MKIVVNRCFGGYNLSEEAYEYLGLLWTGYGLAYCDDRINPKLVKCVETLGRKANGSPAADLRVIEIPNDVDWEIHDYDGYETIHEKHRVW